MPLPIAHGIVGAAIVALVHPKANFKNWRPLLIGFLLANAADLDFGFVWFLGWRGFHRGVTHSLLFALVVAAILFVWLRKRNWRVPLAFSLAYLSHTLLDAATSGAGSGTALLLPFNRNYYALALFNIPEMIGGFTASNLLRFSLLEFLCCAPLFLIMLFVKQKLLQKH